MNENLGQSRRWSTAMVVAIGCCCFTAGSLWSGLPAMAEVTKTPPRDTFKDGGVIANETLLESLGVLKKLDERVARIEKALLKAVEQ